MIIRIKGEILISEGKKIGNGIVNINHSPLPRTADITNVIDTRKKGSNPFIVGVSGLNEGTNFCKSVDYYMGSEFANQQGKFASPYVMQFALNDFVNNITICFDDYNNRFPNKVEVYEVLGNSVSKLYDFSDNDPVFNIPLKNQYGGGLDKFLLKFNTWNKPKYPCVIQGIYIANKIDLTPANLLSCEVKRSDRGDINHPSWGIRSNTGSISIKDINGEISDYADQNSLVDGLETKIYIENIQDHKDTLIANMVTEKWNYDIEDKTVNVTLADRLVEWQYINITGIPYNPLKWNYKALSDVYKYLYSQTPKRFKMQEFDLLDEATKNQLNNIWLTYPVLKESNLWRAWDKLCQVAQSHIYTEANGTTVFKYNGGD